MKGSIKEGYLTKWKEYPTDEFKVKVATPCTLAPSRELLEKYKDGEISWDIYRSMYVEYLSNNEKMIEELKELKEMAEDGKDVRLICYEKEPPCHRFILKEILENDLIDEIVEREYEDIISGLSDDEYAEIKRMFYEDKGLEAVDWCLQKFCTVYLPTEDCIQMIGKCKSAHGIPIEPTERCMHLDRCHYSKPLMNIGLDKASLILYLRQIRDE